MRRRDVELVYGAETERGAAGISAVASSGSPGTGTPARSASASVHGYLTATDKGGKTLTKPLPSQYVQTIIEADAAGVWDSPADYLIPNRRPSTVRSEVKRSDKVIWNTVKIVAERAGVDSHVHALRAVFAEACAEMGMDLTEVQDLMGHSRPETTQVYLDRRGREKRMEKVRDLSFGFASRTPESASLSHKAHTGFEPVIPSDQLEKDVGQRQTLDRTGGAA